MKSDKIPVIIETYSKLSVYEEIEKIKCEKWAVSEEKLNKVLSTYNIPTIKEIRENNLYVVIFDMDSVVWIDAEDIRFNKVKRERIYSNQEINHMYQVARYYKRTFESVKDEFDRALDL